MDETFHERAREIKLPSGAHPYKIGMIKIAIPHEKNAIQKLEMRILVHSQLPMTTRWCAVVA